MVGYLSFPSEEEHSVSVLLQSNCDESYVFVLLYLNAHPETVDHNIFIRFYDKVSEV